MGGIGIKDIFFIETSSIVVIRVTNFFTRKTSAREQVNKATRWALFLKPEKVFCLNGIMAV